MLHSEQKQMTKHGYTIWQINNIKNLRMKKIINFIIFTTIGLFIFTSCKKNQLGGDASLTGIVMHHNKPISNAKVYIKFNTTEFPGADSTIYDSFVQADGNGNYSIPFYKGSYYVFAIGRDLAITYPYLVKGGLSISVRNREKLTKNIAVTED